MVVFVVAVEFLGFAAGSLESYSKQGLLCVRKAKARTNVKSKSDCNLSFARMRVLLVAVPDGIGLVQKRGGQSANQWVYQPCLPYSLTSSA